MNEQHEGKRKNEALWPVFQITWQRSRYVYDMHYVYKAISKDVLEYCIRSVSEPAFSLDDDAPTVLLAVDVKTHTIKSCGIEFFLRTRLSNLKLGVILLIVWTRLVDVPRP